MAEVIIVFHPHRSEGDSVLRIDMSRAVSYCGGSDRVCGHTLSTNSEVVDPIGGGRIAHQAVTGIPHQGHSR